jgi:hypothetical protein
MSDVKELPDMTDKNPFKRLFRAVYWCGVLRIAAALGVSLYWDNPLVGLVPFILVSALTDVAILRPLFKKTFVPTGMNAGFADEHVNWLQEKHDISPENLMVFFRKILTFRALSLSLAIISIPLLWAVKGQAVALVSAPFVYAAAMLVMLVCLHRSVAVLPKSYKCVPNHSASFRHHHISGMGTDALDRMRAGPRPYSLEWNILYRGVCRTGI